MPQQLLSYKKSVIHYSRFGTGSHILLCFHGYAEQAVAFDFLEKYIGSQYTVYAVDLPFHGETEWREGLLFTREDLTTIIKSILKAETEKAADTGQITLMGFSLGGRTALSIYQAMPEKINKLVLLAPDGLKVNFWYWLSTQTMLGNKLFFITMRYPGWFFGLLKLMNILGLVNASIFKFVNYYIGNAGLRDLLYARWTSLRKIKPDIEQIKSLIGEHHTPVRLVYGKHDRIMLSSVGEKFRKGIENQCRVTVIPSGHQVLHEKHAEYMLQALTG